MTRRQSRSFRGLHALIEHPPGRDRTVLSTQLEFLGLRVTVHDSAAPSYDSIDILFFDADSDPSKAMIVKVQKSFFHTRILSCHNHA